MLLYSLKIKTFKLELKIPAFHADTIEVMRGSEGASSSTHRKKVFSPLPLGRIVGLSLYDITFLNLLDPFLKLITNCLILLD
jgi:hypothetical protein